MGLSRLSASQDALGPAWPIRCLQYPFVAGMFWRFTRHEHAYVMSLRGRLAKMASDDHPSGAKRPRGCKAQSSRRASRLCGRVWHGYGARGLRH